MGGQADEMTGKGTSLGLGPTKQLNIWKEEPSREAGCGPLGRGAEENGAPSGSAVPVPSCLCTALKLRNFSGLPRAWPMSSE